MQGTVIRRRTRMAALAGLFTLLLAPPAWANQPPAGPMILAEVLILPLMVILTAAGGGYALMAAKGARRRWAPKIIVVVLVVFLSLTHEGLALCITVIFALIALLRATRMIRWGVVPSAPEGTAEPGPRPLRARLIVAGLVLAVAAVLLGGAGPALLGWWPGDWHAEEELKMAVAYQMARGRLPPGSEEAPVYPAPTVSPSGGLVFVDPDLVLRPHTAVPGAGYRRNYGTEFRLGPRGESFQMWTTPYHFPVFPYNTLITLPSFYADETGEVRMIRVRRAGQRCPADALVHYRVGDEDMEMIENLLPPPEKPGEGEAPR